MHETLTTPPATSRRERAADITLTGPTGQAFHPFAPVAEEVHLLDLIVGLANTCRFNGLMAPGLSVAEHSVAVCRRAQMKPVSQPQPWLPLVALLHDAAEIWIGDIPSPIKKQVRFVIDGEQKTAHQVEAEILTAIFAAFGVTAYEADNAWPYVKSADDVQNYWENEQRESYFRVFPQVCGPLTQNPAEAGLA